MYFVHLYIYSVVCIFVDCHPVAKRVGRTIGVNIYMYMYTVQGDAAF